MKASRKLHRAQQPQSLLDYVRQFLTPQDLKQARQAVPARRSQPRWDLQPLLIITLVLLQNRGFLPSVNREHYHDLGKLMFGFTVFYAYIAFSQFFLIYYADIPETTVWFYYRFEDNWIYLAYMLLFGRFIVPFVLLLKQSSKSNLNLLYPVSILIIFLHFVEIYWIVMPIMHEHGFSVHWLDIATVLGLSGLLIGLFFSKFKQYSMVPKNDPRLLESLNKH
jgi:hypothetical protein